MSSEAVVRSLLVDGAKANADSLAADVILRHPWGTFRGRDPVIEVENELVAGFPDRKVEVTTLLLRPGRAVARTVWRGTHTGRFRGAKATGKHADVITFYDFELDGDQVTSIEAVTDSLHIFQELGFFPAAKSVPAPIAYGALLRQKVFRDRGSSSLNGLTPTDDGLHDDPALPTAVTRKYIEAAVAPDYVTALEALVDEDAVLHYHTSDVPLHGRDEAVAVVANLRNGFPDMTFVPRVILGDDEKAIQFSVWSGTQTGRFQGIPPTNRRVTLSIAGQYRVRNGRLVELEIVLDSVSVLYQLGVFPRIDPIPRPLRPLLRLRAGLQKQT